LLDDDEDDDIDELQANIGEEGVIIAGFFRSLGRAQLRSMSPEGSLIMAETGKVDDADDLEQESTGNDEEDDTSDSDSEWDGVDDNTMGHGKDSGRKRKKRRANTKVLPEHREHYEYLRRELEHMPPRTSRSAFIESLHEKVSVIELIRLAAR